MFFGENTTIVGFETGMAVENSDVRLQNVAIDNSSTKLKTENSKAY
jgi:hypothetical protein